MKKLLFLYGLSTLLLWSSMAFATFTSGSTGADGPFNPASNIEVVLPPDGVLNYTTVDVPAGVTVTFKKNATNTPVYMLATGDVNIAGTIDVSGQPGSANVPIEGGPGGFNGSYGGPVNMGGGRGMGPGGGGPAIGPSKDGGGGRLWYGRAVNLG